MLNKAKQKPNTNPKPIDYWKCSAV